MEILLRELKQSDILELANIYIGAYGDKNWNETWTVDMACLRISEIVSNPHCMGFVCTINDQIAGCMLCEVLTWCSGKQLEIKELFVNVKYQRCGVGRKLVEHLRLIKRDLNVSEIVLWTNRCPTLMSFYTNVGFRVDSDTLRFIM